MPITQKSRSLLCNMAQVISVQNMHHVWSKLSNERHITIPLLVEQKLCGNQVELIASN